MGKLGASLCPYGKTKRMTMKVPKTSTKRVKTGRHKLRSDAANTKQTTSTETIMTKFERKMTVILERNGNSMIEDIHQHQ